MVFWDTSPPSCLSVGWPNKVTIPLTQQLVCGFIWLSGCEQYMLGLRNTCIAPTQTKYSIWFPHHINAFHQRASPSRPWLPVLWGVWAPSPLSSQCLCPDLWTTAPHTGGFLLRCVENRAQHTHCRYIRVFSPHLSRATSLSLSSPPASHLLPSVFSSGHSQNIQFMLLKF